MLKVRAPAVVASLVVAFALTQGCATTNQTDDESLRTVNSNYVASSTQEVVMGTDDVCVRTISWDAEDGLVECPASAVAIVEPPKVVGSSLVSFRGRALFEFDSSELTSSGKEQLDMLTDKLNSQTTITGIQIVGYTDSIGSDAYNMSLSQRRADSVKGYLDPSLSKVAVKAVGMGETAPVADNATDSGRALNRRVEVNVAATVER